MTKNKSKKNKNSKNRAFLKKVETQYKNMEKKYGSHFTRNMSVQDLKPFVL